MEKNEMLSVHHFSIHDYWITAFIHLLLNTKCTSKVTIAISIKPFEWAINVLCFHCESNLFCEIYGSSFGFSVLCFSLSACIATDPDNFVLEN